MPQPIEYQKVMTEVVYINLPGPVHFCIGQRAFKVWEIFSSAMGACDEGHGQQ